MRTYASDSWTVRIKLLSFGLVLDTFSNAECEDIVFAEGEWRCYGHFFFHLARQSNYRSARENIRSSHQLVDKIFTLPRLLSDSRELSVKVEHKDHLQSLIKRSHFFDNATGNQIDLKRSMRRPRDEAGREFEAARPAYNIASEEIGSYKIGLRRRRLQTIPRRLQSTVSHHQLALLFDHVAKQIANFRATVQLL